MRFCGLGRPAAAGSRAVSSFRSSARSSEAKRSGETKPIVSATKWISCTLGLACLPVLIVSCSPQTPAPPATPAAAATPDLSHVQCRAIVKDALRAARQYVDNSGTGVIPPDYWGDEIAGLHPLRVSEEVEPNIIVYIVLAENPESGLCVCQLDSLGNATPPAVSHLVKLCADPDLDGVLYRYWR